MQVVSITEARNNLKSIFETVYRDQEEVIIHRKGNENIVVIPLDEYNALKETQYLLGNPSNAKRLLESIAQLQRGETIEKTIDDLQ